MKDEYNREISEPTDLVNDRDRPLQDVLDQVGRGQYGKQTARYFLSKKTDRKRYAVR